jgi:type II secretory pathway pseudopilin PulG
MPRLFRLVVLLLVSLSLLSACSGFLTPREERRQKSLLEATETYRKLLRWGSYEQAAQYLRGKGEELPPPDLKKMAHYKISGYYPSDQLQNDTGDEVRVITMIDYYDIDSGVAKSLRDEQYWWYDAEQKHWFLGSPMPDLDAQ